MLKRFTARDIISRWDVIDVYSRATASTAAHFLDKLEQRMPFTVRAIQVDGGSEFEAVLVEFPRRGIWSIGFIINESSAQFGEIQLKIFILGPPNPASGFLWIARENEVV